VDKTLQAASSGHSWPFVLIGLLVVAAYAWQRFNEPSFPNKKALPRTLDPLRYLFLKPAYRKARYVYVFATLLLYCALLAAGPSMIRVLNPVGFKDFPVEGWAMLIALVLTGVGNVGDASASLKWLNTIEEQLRRWVHAWFLVPTGTERTIAILQDASYDPSDAQLNLVPRALRDRVREDLKLPLGTTRYGRARAAALVASLKQVGNGAMSRAAFEPFTDDFEAIITSYKALSWEKKEGGSSDDDRRDDDVDDNLAGSVNDLLRRIYAYISWGIRSEAGSEREVDQTLEKLGFRVPERGGRELLDIVAPAAGLVAVITILFWPSVDFISSKMGAVAPTASESIVFALTSAGGAMLMYGLAALIAFDRRASQIETRAWRAGSPRCLLPIAMWCGAVTWAVVMATTIFGQLPDVERSLTGITHLIGSFAASGADNAPTTDGWTFLPIRFVTALPWMLPGAAVCVILAWSIGGDVRQTDMRQRIRDAMVLEVGLGIAVAAAQLIQTALMEKVFGETANWYYVPIVGLAGAGCGAVIGFMVPYACRANIVTPPDPMVARDLRRLRERAEAAFGSKIAAADWLFMPNNELGGITPAEAVQYKTHATGVRPLLEQDVARILDEARSVGSAPSSVDVAAAAVPIVPASTRPADVDFTPH
jgi:hypothetical protein